MPCTWLPYTNDEIAIVRLRRRIHRLEVRLESMRRYPMESLYHDGIVALEAELVELRGQAGGGLRDSAMCVTI